MKKTLSGMIHEKYIYSRRMNRLAELLVEFLSDSHNVLDVGCGDGMIDKLLMMKDNGLNISGIDVLIRDETFIPVVKYDGVHIPICQGEKPDTLMAIDVLHHTDNPEKLLEEMQRCTEKYIIIKDHYKHGFWSYIKLRFMDYVGNAHYNVRLPYNYLKQEEWERIYEGCGLEVIGQVESLQLYKGLFHWIFDRDLHFIVKLRKGKS